jgi:hypothetical protein
VHPVNKEVMMNKHELAFHPDGEQKFLTAELTGCTNYMQEIERDASISCIFTAM